MINRQYLNYHHQQQQKAIRGRFTIFKTVSRQCSHAHIKTLHRCVPPGGSSSDFSVSDQKATAGSTQIKCPSSKLALIYSLFSLFFFTGPPPQLSTETLCFYNLSIHLIVCILNLCKKNPKKIPQLQMHFA